MSTVIRPILLVPNKNVAVEYKNNDKPPAMGMVEYDGNAFRITIERKFCLANYVGSWLNSKITFEEFLCGVLLHEVAHIKYDSFVYCQTPNEKQAHDNVWKHIDNVLEDARIEYKLSFEHPSYAQYLRWLLAALKTDLDITKAQKTDAAGDAAKLQKYLRELYAIARFGIIEGTYDKAFARLAIPLIYSAMRGERENEVTAVNVIYDYLRTKVDMKNVAQYVNTITIVMTKAQVDELLKNATVSEDNAHGNAVLQIMVEGTKKADASCDNRSTGRMAGSGDNELVIEDKDNAFYRSTVEEYSSIIAQLRRVFKRLFESIKFERDYDGEIDMRYQQNIYANSFTNDSSRDYQRIARVHRDLDVAILRDVSGSTSNVKEVYAAAVVCLLASIDGLSNVRSAAVDFSERHRVAKAFDSQLRQSAIYPVCEGGTVIGSALREIAGWKWKAKNRIVFVITDGEISDSSDCAQQMKALARTHGIKFYLIDIGGGCRRSVNGIELTNSSIEQLPETIAAKILLRVGGEKHAET